jgi:hypothetical protein
MGVDIGSARAYTLLMARDTKEAAMVVTASQMRALVALGNGVKVRTDQLTERKGLNLHSFKALERKGLVESYKTGRFKYEGCKYPETCFRLSNSGMEWLQRALGGGQ